MLHVSDIASTNLTTLRSIDNGVSDALVFRLDSPATIARVRLACGDPIAAKV